MAQDKIDIIVKAFQDRLKANVKGYKHFDNYGIFNSELDNKSLMVECNSFNVSEVLVDNRLYEVEYFVNIYGFLPKSNVQNGGTLTRLAVSEICRLFTNWNYKDEISGVDVAKVNLTDGTIGSSSQQGNSNGFVVSFKVTITNQDTF